MEFMAVHPYTHKAKNCPDVFLVVFANRSREVTNPSFGVQPIFEVFTYHRERFRMVN
jgi:hypothetical protein